MERDKELKKELRDFSLGLGSSLFGIADIKVIKKEINFSSEILKNFDYAICLGLRLSGAVLEDLESAPTKIYYHHYRQVNMALDQIALRIVNFIQGKGYKALPIPASQIVDWENQTAHLSHKKIGKLAGLGFIGKNNLLVNPQIGAQFRLVTILTDAPVEPDRPSDVDCGTCRACVDMCPSGAIKEKRQEFDHKRCFEKLKEFRDKRLVGQFICGVCVKACKGKI